VLGSAAALVLAPAAILIARFCKGNPAWFRWHRALNILTAVCVIVAFALATSVTGNEFVGEAVSYRSGWRPP
jgi:hypothetical protein